MRRATNGAANRLGADPLVRAIAVALAIVVLREVREAGRSRAPAFVTLNAAKRIARRSRSALLRALRVGAIRGTYSGGPGSGRWTIDQPSLMSWAASQRPRADRP